MKNKLIQNTVLAVLTLFIAVYSVLTIEDIDWPFAFSSFGMLLFTFFAIPFLISLSEKKLKPRLKDFFNFGIYLFLSLVGTLLIFKFKTHYPFDDAGFTLRYLDNFKNGFFYCYNPSDGPVFGISSFTNTVLCAVPVVANVLSPEKSLLVSNLLGTLLISLALIFVFKKFFPNPKLYLSLWAVVFFGAKMFIDVCTSGIETPFHLAVILWVFVAFLYQKQGWMFFLGAFSILTKLDAVPVIGVIFISFFIDQFSLFKNVSLNNPVYLKLLLFFVLPLVIWILFSFKVFDGPFPQSANAKIHFYENIDNYWFPFLIKFVVNKFTLSLLIFFLVLFILQIIITIVSKTELIAREFSFGFAFIAIMFLYYLYNPAEKMLWYYAVPAMLMMVQLSISLVWLVQKLKSKFEIPALFILFLFIMMFNLKDIKGSTKWLNKFTHVTENERIKIGEYLGNTSTKNDTLLSSHGHISRHFKGYVLDNSGLNSKVTSSYKLNKDSIISCFNPQFIVNHAWNYYLKVPEKYNYSIDQIHYDICTYNDPPWLILKRKNTNPYRVEKIPANWFANQPETIENKYNYKVIGEQLEFVPQVDSIEFLDKISFGITKQLEAFQITITAIYNDSLKFENEFKIDKLGITSDISMFIQTVDYVLPIKSAELKRILITSNSSPKKLEIYSPFVFYLINVQ